ncbi:RNase A-like domain-containing protein [Roseomonas sp. BN140053]|uniref:RNase A-like domain-containing protein n=1 Tax=Roseomonas sp. BN140053 TaxID=3391898 RepID=UPI0039E8B50C
MSEEDGLQVVLSPVQLAAVLQGATLGESASLGTRLWGAVTVLGGGLELVGSAGLLLTPEPTMITKAGGVALGLHGADNVSSGLQQVWTGQRTVTMTHTAVAAAARAMGASPDQADTTGMVVDMLVPLFVAGAVGAARALAVRGGRLSLAAEEAAGGHTIARHVGRTEAQLRARLAAETKIPAATTFRSLAEAERFVSQVMRARAADIASWAHTAAPGATKAFTQDAGQVVGRGVVRATGALQDMTKLRVVLRKTAVQGRIYFVLTAFPVP